MHRIAVIIAAAGSSVRMGGKTKKQYMMCGSCPVLVKTARLFYGRKGVSQIVVSVPEGDCSFVLSMLERYGITDGPACRITVSEGGARRQDSVFKALKDVSDDADLVLIQDGARPFTPQPVIDGVIKALEGGAVSVVPGVTPKSTIRTAEKTLVRSGLFEVQTPQGFKKDLLVSAYENAIALGLEVTDDASVAEAFGAKTVITPGDHSNIKITTPEDLPKKMRVGTGYDVHRLVGGRPLMLGCVNVPYEKGLLGHSDADVIAHAIADALLGAAALGDIGKLFPDNSPLTEGMSGSELLSKTAEFLENQGFTIRSADATLIAEKPKVSPYTDAMRQAVADALRIDKSFVSIKATTEEGLGFTGNGSAMACQAVCTVE